ncbi:unnamed protein product [Parascedosporium putredinis]|uniref:DNA/RNA-binding protein Kin17 WH-like domain-containing protein n=1 Tax=Parascedosporium putredinis TaxID=1442378 RepID=A0A9P1GU40_9PEZI|nr:unnamed protein product [Parascedosporium putredinis]CAI7987422.1 unnamed protein product [Parascedosporium putredinis]
MAGITDFEVHGFVISGFPLGIESRSRVTLSRRAIIEGTELPQTPKERIYRTLVVLFRAMLFYRNLEEFDGFEKLITKAMGIYSNSEPFLEAAARFYVRARDQYITRNGCDGDRKCLLASLVDQWRHRRRADIAASLKFGSGEAKDHYARQFGSEDASYPGTPVWEPASTTSVKNGPRRADTAINIANSSAQAKAAETREARPPKRKLESSSLKIDTHARRPLSPNWHGRLDRWTPATEEAATRAAGRLSPYAHEKGHLQEMLSAGKGAEVASFPLESDPPCMAGEACMVTDPLPKANNMPPERRTTEENAEPRSQSRTSPSLSGLHSDMSQGPESGGRSFEDSVQELIWSSELTVLSQRTAELENLAISNKLKSKGLTRLRWYCQVCEKACRDANAFKMHCMSESHVRNMVIVGENSKAFIQDYSDTLMKDFIGLLKTAHGEKQVNANHFYQEYIANKDHVHMNATKRQEALRRKNLQDQGDEELETKMIREQIKRAQAAAQASHMTEEERAEKEQQLKQAEETAAKDTAAPGVATDGQELEPAVGKEETAPAAKPAGLAGFSMKASAKPQTKNVFALAKKNKKVMSEQPKKMSEAERIMKEETDRKRAREGSGFGGPSVKKRKNF